MWCCEAAGRSSILHSLLSAPRCCSCAAPGTLVAIRAPQLVFAAASDVLRKTFRFVKNVPCFRGLPAGDQLRLVRNSWAPLLLLGMGQDAVHFDTVETGQMSLLRRILTHSSGDTQQQTGVPATDAQGIQMFLVECRKLRITVREYSFLKGAILFCPEVTGLECRDYIQALRREAERALCCEHVYGKPLHRTTTAERRGTLGALMDALRCLDPDTVAGLFFGPATGTASVDQHVLTLFYAR